MLSSTLEQRYSRPSHFEITIQDSNVLTGFGEDQCRKRERVVGANTLRLVLAAARTLWFVEHTARFPTPELQRYRPWYRHKVAPSQLDIVLKVAGTARPTCHQQSGVGRAAPAITGYV